MSKKNWMKSAVKHPGAFTRKAKDAGYSVQTFALKVLNNPDRYSDKTRKQAQLARTFARYRKH